MAGANICELTRQPSEQFCIRCLPFTFVLMGVNGLCSQDRARDGVSALSIASISETQVDMLWFPVISYVIITGLVVQLLNEELVWYVNARHSFLKEPRIENFSIMIEDLPRAFQSEHLLRQFFQRMYPPFHLFGKSRESVLDVTVTAETHDLAELQRRAERLRD
eukprot:SAG31_NODE_16666_length_700_cov_1.788686_1_plen_163_part_10